MDDCMILVDCFGQWVSLERCQRAFGVGVGVGGGTSHRSGHVPSHETCDLLNSAENLSSRILAHEDVMILEADIGPSSPFWSAAQELVEMFHTFLQERIFESMTNCIWKQLLFCEFQRSEVLADSSQELVRSVVEIVKRQASRRLVESFWGSTTGPTFARCRMQSTFKCQLSASVPWFGVESTSSLGSP